MVKRLGTAGWAGWHQPPRWLWGAAIAIAIADLGAIAFVTADDGASDAQVTASDSALVRAAPEPSASVTFGWGSTVAVTTSGPPAPTTTALPASTSESSVTTTPPSTAVPTTLAPATTAPTATVPTTTPAPTTAPPAPTTTAPPAETPTTQAPAPRSVSTQNYVPFASIGWLDLHHPSARVERIGFHQANHDGAQQMTPTAEASRPFTMSDRGRGTGSRTAADIVSEPGAEIRSPVNGVVKRAGTYVLYCDKTDNFVVITPEPERLPDWEVKLLHITGLAVQPGDQVVAGVTKLADSARTLPFTSQVDDDTSSPSWPHVHLEVVDTAIPDRPNGGSGSENC